MEELISSADNIKEEIDTSVKDSGRSKIISDTKYPGNLWHYEKTKPKNHRTRITIPVQRPRKIFSTKS